MALESASLDRLVISTDDPEIAEVGKKLGAEVPFLRPAELAADTSASLDVILTPSAGWIKTRTTGLTMFCCSSQPHHCEPRQTFANQ